jgi:hypothetical protein
VTVTHIICATVDHISDQFHSRGGLLAAFFIPELAAVATNVDVTTLLFLVSKIYADIHGLARVMVPIL